MQGEDAGALIGFLGTFRHINHPPVGCVQMFPWTQKRRILDGRRLVRPAYPTLLPYSPLAVFW